MSKIVIFFTFILIFNKWFPDFARFGWDSGQDPVATSGFNKDVYVSVRYHFKSLYSAVVIYVYSNCSQFELLTISKFMVFHSNIMVGMLDCSNSTISLENPQAICENHKNFYERQNNSKKCILVILVY